MDIGDNDRNMEIMRLEKVEIILKQKLLAVLERIRKYKDSIVSERKQIWEEMPHLIWDEEDLVELVQNDDLLKNNEQEYHLLNHEANILKKMIYSPYFGRVDFREQNGKDVEKLYIGIASLIDDDTDEFLIYDWRAPISSMFYDYEPGPASYAAPMGVIYGEILLKRQYRIENGKMVYMFDSSLKIDDDILQEVLAKNADDKMRTIVNTIQREQNKAIRDEKYSVLIVQGPAGSGKTSIALHRAAYLLYRHRKTIKASNILIFSPNRIFSDYISDVLPELGEENVLNITFEMCMRKVASGRYRIEDMNGQMEYFLSAGKDADYNIRLDSMKFKMSDAYYKIIKKYISYLDSKAPEFKDVEFGGEIVVTKEELEEFYAKVHKSLPLAMRLYNVKNRAMARIEELEAERVMQIEDELYQDTDMGGYTDEEIKRIAVKRVNQEKAAAEKRIDEWANVDAYELYGVLFNDLKLFREISEEIGLPENLEAIARLTVRLLDEGRPGYEDAIAITYMDGCLKGFQSIRDIKYAIIDEAQDYTLMQHETIRRMFPYTNFTMLGDIDQSINPFVSVEDLEVLKSIYGSNDTNVMRLQRSYRSTPHIINFALDILKNGKDVDTVERFGIKPAVVKVSDTTRLHEIIIRDIEAFRREGFMSIAVICRTAEESRMAYANFKGKGEFILVTTSDSHFTTGLVILPSYLAKGLEFDVVLLYDAGNGNYSDEMERKLLYTACTRALHRLNIYYTDNLSPFIECVDRELYTFIEY